MTFGLSRDILAPLGAHSELQNGGALLRSQVTVPLAFLWRTILGAGLHSIRNLGDRIRWRAAKVRLRAGAGACQPTISPSSSLSYIAHPGCCNHGPVTCHRFAPVEPRCGPSVSIAAVDGGIPCPLARLIRRQEKAPGGT